jgi:hypothetical protein
MSRRQVFSGAAGNGNGAIVWQALRLDDRVVAEDAAGRITTITDTDGLWTVTMTTTGAAASATTARGLRRFTLPGGVAIEGDRNISFRATGFSFVDDNNLQPYMTIGVAGLTAGRVAGVAIRDTGDPTKIRVGALAATASVLTGGSPQQANLADAVLRADTRPGSQGPSGRVDSYVTAEILGSSNTRGTQQTAGATVFAGGNRIEVGVGHVVGGTVGQTCQLTFRPFFAVFPALAA